MSRQPHSLQQGADGPTAESLSKFRQQLHMLCDSTGINILLCDRFLCVIRTFRQARIEHIIFERFGESFFLS